MVLSWDPDARQLPSPEKHKEVTALLCPVRDRINFPSVTDHSWIVRSVDPEATQLPSGEKVTALTRLLCPSMVIGED